MLYRSEKNKVPAGVAAGLGEYFKIDPTTIRLLFVLFAFIHGSGIFLYIILWLVLPTKSKVTNNHEAMKQNIKDNLDEVREKVGGVVQAMRVGKDNNSRKALGILLIVLGTIILFDNLRFPIWFETGRFWPLLLIVLGFYLVPN